MGLSGRAKRYYFSYSLSCNWDSVLFSHEFLIMPESPSPLLGRDILSKVHASVFMNMEPSLSLPFGSRFLLTCNILEQNFEKEWKSPIFGNTLTHLFVSQGASLVAQTVKNQPAMQETQVQSLGWEESLEKWMTTQSSILAWRIPWTEKPGGLQSMDSQRVGHDWATDTFKGPSYYSGVNNSKQQYMIYLASILVNWEREEKQKIWDHFNINCWLF